MRIQHISQSAVHVGVVLTGVIEPIRGQVPTGVVRSSRPVAGAEKLTGRCSSGLLVVWIVGWAILEPV
jgi:hypothetical protein